MYHIGIACVRHVGSSAPPAARRFHAPGLRVLPAETKMLLLRGTGAAGAWPQGEAGCRGKAGR